MRRPATRLFTSAVSSLHNSINVHQLNSFLLPLLERIISAIPDKARNTPNYVNGQVKSVESTTTTTKTTTPSTTTRSSNYVVSTEVPLPAGVTAPSRHLLPPLPPLLQRRPFQIQGKLPSEFGLRMKEKMRFTRSPQFGSDTMPLPLSIQEPFPVTFDHDFVVNLDRQIRSRRSIDGPGSANHHHHHHDDEPVDRGCTILGVRYELGEVVGNTLNL